MKVAFKTSKRTTTVSYIFKSILFTAVCFCYLQPSAIAQKLNLDQRVLINMMENRSEGVTKLMQGISDNTQLVSVLIPATVVAAGLIDNNKMTLKKGLYLAESAAAATFISYGMKYSFKRSRPFMVTPGLTAAGTGSSPSFPSGHTSVAFASATSLTLAYPKWYVAVPAYTWAASVGYSRMYLGVHYPSDVLAGAVIGAGSAWLMHKANKWLFRKKPKD
ncbi:phosphatase PAP2 family protein [Longitalea luteola]|uniref:phosphatase PAP2 family protein n=1 Tax=Longitalea luteola TaxID=2812563 RepID=UPI001F61D846|nr:phosphatase PAP2 family protein [Longitalea luteola]